MLTQLDAQTEIYQVVHPLDDVPEEKCSPEKLGAMHMTPINEKALFQAQGAIC